MADPVAHFADLTGASAETARQYLSTADGDLETAVATYFAAQDGESASPAHTAADAAAARTSRFQVPPPVPSPPTDARSAAAPAYTGPRTLSGAPAPAAEPWPSQASGAPSSGAAGLGGFGSSSRAPAGQRRTGIATLGSLAGEPGAAPRGGSGIGSNVHGFGSSSGPSSSSSTSRHGHGTYRHGNIGRLQHDDGPDSDDNADTPNLYTGGERSGLSVQDPEAHRRQRLLQALAQARQGGDEGQGMDLVNNILRQAAEGGPAPPPFAGGASAGAGEDSSAGGHSWGHGRAVNAPEPAPGPMRGDEPTDGDEEDEEDEEDELAVRHLIFWADGFTVEDSELYRYDDPENQRLLRAIESQRAPNSVFNVRPDQQVDLHIERRMDQPYTPPPPGPTRSFAGAGNRLGSPVVPSGGASPAPASAPPAPASAAAAPAVNAGAGAPHPAFELDTSQPVTTLQLRLADGTRLVQKFNQTHTVGDVRRFLTASGTSAPDQPFILTSSFPPKALTDDAQTLKDAGLLNAVVIQKRA